MLKTLEKKLWRQAAKKKLKGKRKSAFVHGTMRKAGWKPGLGEAMSRWRA